MKVKVKSLSHVRLFAIPWTAAHQAPLSMGFSRQEYWSGLPFPSPGDLPHPGIKPRSPTLWTDALPSEPSGKSKQKWKSLNHVWLFETLWTIQSSGPNTGVGSLSLLQGIFSTQGLNPGLLHCRQILYQLSHKGSPSAMKLSLNKVALWGTGGCCRCSVAKLCPTLCDPMDCSMWGSLVLHYLLELVQSHVHWLNDAI